MGRALGTRPRGTPVSAGGTRKGSSSTALLFPGLAPAKHGRVADFLDGYAPASAMVRQVDEVLGYSLLDRYSTADVYDWEVYQTAHMVTCLALADARMRAGDGLDRTLSEAPVVCGQSFGGFAAAVYSGACDLPDLIRALRVSTEVESEYFAEQEEALGCVFFTRMGRDRREALMKEVMASTGGWLDLSVVQDRQVVAVSGTRTAVDELSQRLREERAIVFYVMNRAEHCSQMAPLVRRLRERVYEGLALKDPRLPLVADDGSALHTAEDVREDLSAGWSRPLIADQLYAKLLERGVRRIITPASRGSFTDFGSGRFEIEVVLPNRMLQQLRQVAPGAEVRERETADA